MIPPVISIEFEEDRNGALSCDIRTLTSKECLLWHEFVDCGRYDRTINRIYDYVLATYPFLLDRKELGLNLTKDKMIWQLRRFISKWLGASEKNSRDWEEYTDGTVMMHLDEKTCKQNCPVLIRAISTLKEFQFSGDDNYAAEFVARKTLSSHGITNARTDTKNR